MSLARKSLRVWVLQTGEPVPGDSGEPRPMRAMNLCKALVDSGHDVTLWTSDFFHQEKRHRFGAYREVRISDRLAVRFVPSPGYSRNIGPARLVDHAVLASNLRIALRGCAVPDVAFLGYPPIETAAVMGRWLSDRRVPFMLDVKDQWPVLFVTALPRALRPLARVMFAPYFVAARGAMRRASGLAAMAPGFLDWALGFAGRARGAWDRVVPLAPQMNPISTASRGAAQAWWDQRGIVDDGRPRFCFVGSHSQAFDFAPVVDAARLLAMRGVPAQFVVGGSGERTAAWQAMAADLPSVVFPGWLDQAQSAVLAERCFASLAPYRRTDDFSLSVPNKVLDSLGHGLPVLSPLLGEVRALLVENGVGLSYEDGDGTSLCNAILKLTADDSSRKRMRQAALALFADRFSFSVVYAGLVSHLESLARDRSNQ